MKLIINADDFGMSKGVNYGIFEAHKNGVVTSTTLMITMPEVDHALSLAKNAKDLGIGLHLNITCGEPLTNCKTIVKENGSFYKPLEEPNENLFDEDEIYNEFLAQFNLFVKKVGKKPTHFDSHLYAHQLYKKAEKAIIKLASETNVPVRGLKINGYKPVIFNGWFKKRNGTTLRELFHSNFNELIKEEYSELMVHPAYIDEYLMNFSTYNLPRVEEFQVLTSEEIKMLIKSSNIDLINYGDLRG